MSETPADRPFILDVPADGTSVDAHDGFDLYRPDAAAGPLPAVVFVPGPVPAEWPVPKDWPVYRGYGRLAAGAGVAAVVPDLPYHSVADAPTATAWLREIVGRARALPDLDGDRVAVWAFSGGALLVGGLLAEAPRWLRCLALTYPVLPGALPLSEQQAAAAPPVLLTRVGREAPERQESLRAFVDGATAAGLTLDVLDVPDGEHGFDLLEPTEAGRDAVRAAMAGVVAHLTG